MAAVKKFKTHFFSARIYFSSKTKEKLSTDEIVSILGVINALFFTAILFVFLHNRIVFSSSSK